MIYRIKVWFRGENNFTRSQILSKIVNTTNAAPLDIRTDGVGAELLYSSEAALKQLFAPEHQDGLRNADLIIVPTRCYLADRTIFVSRTSVFIASQVPDTILSSINI